MNRTSKSLSWLLLMLLAAPGLWAQQLRQPPRAGYVYPAGGRAGDSFEVTVGGQYLAADAEVRVSGRGVEAQFVDYDRPPTQKEIANIREIFQRAQKQVQEDAKAGKRGGRGALMQTFATMAKAEGITDRQTEAFNKYRRERADPKRQLNPQLSESLKVKITIAPNAEPGTRELRVTTPLGLSNPIRFRVGTLPESRETEPNDRMAAATAVGALPAVLNGQIMPGDVDRFRIPLRAGQHLVVNVSARDLIPYLADAVPGWFQATVALYDANGREVARVDDYRFDPDPVLLYKVPRDGNYVLEIADAIYRGREDFVYRVTVGELPFVSGIFPLGARRGERVTVEVDGQNLPFARTGLDLAGAAIGQVPFLVSTKTYASNVLPFAVDDLPELREAEPNDDARRAANVTLPVIVNGRIDRPGDVDMFRFHAERGAAVVAEVWARRLGSPLDSLLRITDADGRPLALNDDCEDKGCGLVTHHADSRLAVTIPNTGDYLVSINDVQKKGGRDCAYRLRLGPGRPDFELRVVPSAVNARGGITVPITVYALRRDGFAGDIALRLKDAPRGFVLSGAWVPAGQESCTLTLTVPANTPEKLTPLALEGTATVDGRAVRREALPADDMEQAFIYRHLVPAESWTAAVQSGPGRWGGPGWAVDAEGPVKLKAGEATHIRVRAAGRAVARQFHLELSEAPEGITLESVTPVAGGVNVVVRTDASKVKPGLKGNLIISAFVEWQGRTKDGKPNGQTRRIPAGVLPAIPFEVTGR